MFGGLLRKRRSTAWEYAVDGVLWRLLPAAEGFLLGEDRDLEQKTVSFFCLDDTTGSFRWKGLAFPEKWWISMEVLHRNVLILHEYAAPDMPDHKKLYAVDVSTGAALWSNDEAKFLFAHGEHIYAARETFEERIFTEIRLVDGVAVREIGAPELHELQRSLGREPAGRVVFPSIVRPGESVDPGLSEALSALRKNDAEETLTEYIETGSSIVAAWCSASPPAAPERSFRQRIGVYDRTRRRVEFEDEMNAKLSMPIPDMFFCKGSFAYYIKEKRTLCAVHLK